MTRNKPVIEFNAHTLGRLDRLVKEGLLHVASVAERLESKQQPWPTLALQLRAMTESIHTFTYAYSFRSVRDCLILGRSLFELALDIGYMCTDLEPLLQKAARHAQQKSFRDLQRTLSIEVPKLHIRWTGNLDATRVPGLRDALEEFTNARGKEKRKWTDTTIAERLNQVCDHYGSDVTTPMKLAFFAFYRHGSEAVHGTLFSTLFVLGQTSPANPANGEDFSQYQTDMLCMCAMTVNGIEQSILSMLQQVHSHDEMLKETVRTAAAREKEIFSELRK